MGFFDKFSVLKSELTSKKALRSKVKSPGRKRREEDVLEDQKDFSYLLQKVISHYLNARKWM